MTPFTRAPEPDVLASGAARWAAAWMKRRDEAREAGKRLPPFGWPTVGRRTLNRHLEPVLLGMTAGHCAYCDAFPIRGAATPTIDHFQPKSASPELAFTWANLYPACNCCQDVKGERFHADLLRPDDLEYGFDRYFLYDHASGELQPNPGADAADRARASVSIDVFGLNAEGRPSMRKRAVRDARAAGPDADPLNDHAYRFAVQDALDT